MASTALIEARQGPVMPLDTHQVQMAMTAYQEGLKSILDDTDWQTFKTRRGDTGQFLKKSGWRKIAYWFNLDLQLVSQHVDRDQDGQPLRARVIARATHPNGRYADGDGYCAASEGGFNKPENDIPGTAATRATNRAISNLVGMGEVSAEELADPGTQPEPPYGPAARSREIAGLERALDALYGPGGDLQTVMDRLDRDAGDYLPRVVARAVMIIAAHRPNPTKRAAAESGPQAGAGTGVDASPETTPDRREDTPPAPDS